MFKEGKYSGKGANVPLPNPASMEFSSQETLPFLYSLSELRRVSCITGKATSCIQNVKVCTRSVTPEEDP